MVSSTTVSTLFDTVKTGLTSDILPAVFIFIGSIIVLWAVFHFLKVGWRYIRRVK